MLIVVKEYPFEVSECGWGEFDAGIRIYFRDPQEQPVDLVHTIKLYSPASPPALKKVIGVFFCIEIVELGDVFSR